MKEKAVVPRISLTEQSVGQLLGGGVHVAGEDNQVPGGGIGAVAGHQVDVLRQLVRLADAVDGVLVGDVLLLVVLGVHLIVCWVVRGAGVIKAYQPICKWQTYVSAEEVQIEALHFDAHVGDAWRTISRAVCCS